MAVRLVILRALSGLALGAGVAGYFASSFWYFDLLNAFLPQMVFGGGFVLAGTMLLKDRWGTGLITVAIVLNLTAMGVRIAEFPAAPRGDNKTLTAIPPVTVMFANVLRTNQQHEMLVNEVQGAKPDILVAAEVGPAWRDALKMLHREYPYRVVIPRPDNFGLAVYSVRPFSSDNVQIVTTPFPMFVILFDEGFRLVAAHPPPPLGAPLAKMQQDYLKGMAKVIAEVVEPLVVVGDLNATLWSQSLAPLKGLGLERADSGVLGWTWPSSFPPLAIRIDHILVKGARVEDAKILEDIGSDHFPVMAELVFPLL